MNHCLLTLADKRRNCKMYEKATGSVTSSSSSSSWSPQLQTKQSYSTACVWFSFRPFLPSSPSFFPLFFRESGRRKQEVAGLCVIPFLNSAPQLLWLETGAGVCLCLYRSPPFTQDHPFFLLISYHSLP